METNREITPIIHGAIERLRSCFGGTRVELLSKEMYRLPPSEFAAAGYLGVDIEIEGIKTFLGHESLAEDIAIHPHGQMFADQFVFDVIKAAHPDLFKDEK
jgi:hypothetical protein